MVHVVQRGETLFQIAKHYGITVGTLVHWNPGLSSAGLVIGQQLLIPARFDRSDVQAAQEQFECRNGKFFQVKNESLIRMMELTGLSFAALMCANPEIDFSGSLDGKQICIPNNDRFSTQETEDVYVVRTGDNFDIITRRLGIPAFELIRRNPSMTFADYAKRGNPIGVPVQENT